ncbi:hypothetical protein BDB00DRAFT_472923 [Zychaea mexicana]|uniref:uncharacterized protein n=1 Tax=Zychaea mexicana TaxID=64656 RepID=UPI0022FEBE0B|nr:uncharacterized protein BDB00DRAFT_472923 [Zychaea mexicana]KAI9491795.1 hypothetical protein BDB00DRAFT_472923 [Zychaea mexicana]
MPPNPTSDWIQLHDRFYRKQEVYSLSWDQTDLSKFMIAGAQYGGPIALIRDDKKVLLLQKQQPIKPTIYMYTAAGKLIEQIQVRYRFAGFCPHYFPIESLSRNFCCLTKQVSFFAVG